MKLLKIALISTTLAFVPCIVFAVKSAHVKSPHVKSAQYACPESGAGTGTITRTVTLSATGGFQGAYDSKEKLTFSKADLKSGIAQPAYPTCYYTTPIGETVELQLSEVGCRKVSANSFMCD